MQQWIQRYIDLEQRLSSILWCLLIGDMPRWWKWRAIMQLLNWLLWSFGVEQYLPVIQRLLSYAPLLCRRYGCTSLSMQNWVLWQFDVET